MREPARSPRPRSHALPARLPRRAVLRAAAGAALVSGAAALGGCGPAPVAAPHPSAAPLRLVVQAAAPGEYAFASAVEWPTMKKILSEAMAPFQARHPGVAVDLVNLPVNPVAAIIAGTGPDIVQLVAAGGGLIGRGLLLDLSLYVKASNLQLSALFAKGTVEAATRNGALYALPYYSETDALAVNLGVLDSLGLEYPPNRWDYTEWGDWSRRVAAALAAAPRSSGTPPHRYATTVAFLGGVPIVGAFYLRGWGGGIVDPADNARCLLDAPQSIACGRFLYALMDEGVAQTGTQLITSQFLAGVQVSAVTQQGFILENATNLRALKWRYVPLPVWPQGAFNFTNQNFVAVNRATRYPELAWEALQWITTSRQYQGALMHASLYPPALKALWPEWVATVHAVAPFLRGQNVEVFASLADEAYLVPVFGGSFAAEDAAAMKLIGVYGQKLVERQLDVTAAFAAAAAQVDALERANAGLQARRQRIQAEFPSRGPRIAAVPPGL